MNIQEMELMNILKCHSYKRQRDLAEVSGYSLGKVNSMLKNLTEQEYLDKELRLTEKARQLYEIHQPKQAIILAAGSGMRMVPINVEVPKGMLEVRNEPLIERIICQLQEVKITDIKIVVGFMKEQYEYLIDKYNVKLVFNEHYSTRNNLYSLAKVKESLENSYIIPCDIWCEENPFSSFELYSWYMVNEQEDEESMIKINRKRELRTVREEENGNRMIGIAYVCAEEAGRLKKKIEEMTGNKRYNHVFWEEAAFVQDRMLFYPRVVSSQKVFEINTLEELRDLDENSNQLNSELLDIISNTLSCELKEIVEIEALKKGMTNRSFRFRCKDKRYIMRIPGEGTGEMINRSQEYSVYQVVGNEGICDPVCYMNPNNGYKITEFVENARVCDPMNSEDVKRSMEYLRKVHEKKLEVNHTFDIFLQIEQYESYWNGERSIYRDYSETKRKMYELKTYIDQQEKEWGLTHIDAVPDNFLFTDDRTYLIDWEYAGMQDPHVDVAMFAIYSMYGRDKVEELIDIYFKGKCPEKVRTKIYCYIAVCGFLWSNWCEYKRICGVEFGEYSLRQYRYAKEYYKIAKERMKDE